MEPVGRAREQQVLTGLLRAAAAGRPGLLVIEGEAGIGKTLLLRSCLAALPPDRTAVALADEAEARQDYALVTQLVPASRAYRSRLAAGRALLALFDRLQAGGDGPAVVAVDDAHWADEPSMSALLLAVRRLRTDRLLLLLAARPQWPVNLQRAVTDALAATDGTRLTLRGLDVEGVRLLASSHGLADLSHRRVEELQRHTGGSPLHLIELFRTVPPERLVQADALPAPPSIAAAVRQRLAVLQTEARMLVAAVAVVGGAPSLALAAAVAGVRDAHQALAAAVDADLLTRAEGSLSPQLSLHPLLAVAVREALRPDELAQLHRAAAELVGTPSARLQHRLAAADGSDLTLAADLAAYAEEQAKVGAFTSAAAHVAAAAGVELDPVARERLWLEAAQLSLMAGDPAHAQELLAQVEDADAPFALYVNGWLALLSGRVEVAEQLLQRAWQDARALQDTLTAGRAADLHALMSLTLGRGRQTVCWATRALQDTRAAMPAATMAMGLAISGQARKALQVLAEVEPLVTGPRIELEQARGTVCLYADDLPGARRGLQAALEEVRRHGDYFLAGSLQANLAEVEQRAGNWDEAVLHSQLALSSLDERQLWLQAPAVALAATVPARRGESDEAQRLVDRARALAAAAGDPLSAAYAAVAAARLADSRADSAGVVDATNNLVAMVERGVDGPAEPGIFDWQELRAEALVRLRRLESARETVELLNGRARERLLRSGVAAADRVRGLLHAVADEPAAAARMLSDAAAEFEALGMPFSRARALLDLGLTQRRWQAARSAERALQEAEEILARLGARPWLDRLARNTAAAADRRRGADDAGSGLRPQELAIAVLIARGLTNKEIARELVLSVKTVEFHLSQVYRRLGLRSRGQLAALVSARAPVPIDR